MKNSKQTKSDAATSNDAAGKQQAPAGTDVDLTSIHDSSAPPMPHERDEGSGMTGGVQSKRVQQGAKDVARGVRDTTRSTEAYQAYAKQKK